MPPVASNKASPKTPMTGKSPKTPKTPLKTPRPVTVDARRVRAGAVAIQPPMPQRQQTDARLRRPPTSSTARLAQRLWPGRLVRGALLAGVAGMSALGVVQLARWVETSDALPVRTVAVRGVEGERADEIIAYSGVVAGQPLFGVDVDDVAQRVREHPFVSSVSVRRVPPDGVEIVVETRAPRAVLAAGDGLYLVDAQGLVMKTARPGDGLDLPLITGLGAEAVASGSAQQALADAVALVATHARMGSPGGALDEVHHDAAGFELVLADGTRARVGFGDVDGKLTRLAEIQRRLQAEGRAASFIFLDDERRPERAAVRLRPETETAPVGGNEHIPRERG